MQEQEFQLINNLKSSKGTFGMDMTIETKNMK